MSLITRCPACGTMFKVVADQLKVSQGWVRCGHCSDVFDASLHLQATQVASAAPVRVPDAPRPVALASTDPVSLEEKQPEPAWSPGVFFPEQTALQKPLIENRLPAFQDSGSSGFDPAGWRRQQQPQLDESGALRLNEYGEAVRIMAAEAQAEDSENQATAFYTQDSISEFPEDVAEKTSTVSFVRDAQRKAFWRRPSVRAMLVLFSLFFTGLLLGQVVVQQKDQLAALQPELKPWLEVLCKQFHCDIRPMQHIEAVVIDSSSFNKIDTDSFRLSFSLKNTGATPVAIPSLEITLTDTQDQAVVRRVLTPAQFGASSPVLVAGADFAGFIVMQVLGSDAVSGAPTTVPHAATTASPLRVAGYRMLAFYP